MTAHFGARPPRDPKEGDVWVPPQYTLQPQQPHEVTLAEDLLEGVAQPLTVLELANVLARLVAQGYGDLPALGYAEGVTFGLSLARVGYDGDARGEVWIGDDRPKEGERHYFTSTGEQAGT